MKKLFLVDGIDYVMAKSKEEAISFYKYETGFDEIDIEEIPEEKWPSITITLDEREEGSDELIKMSFSEYRKQFNEEDPQIVASTEC